MKFTKGWGDIDPCYPLTEGPDPKKTRLVDPCVVDYDLDPGEVVAEPNHWRVHPIVTPNDIAEYVPEFGSDKFWSEFVDVCRRRQESHLVKEHRTKLSDDPILKRLQDHPNLTSDNYISPLFNSQITDARVGGSRVHQDFPSELSTLCVPHMQGKWRDGLVPSTDNLDFATRPLLLADVIGWAPKAVNATVFALKWYFGQPRPEEVFYAWLNGEDIDVPDWVDGILIDLFSDRLKYLRWDANGFLEYNSNIIAQHRFTQYLEGSPFHPSCPAMHGGVAGTNVFFPVLFDLSNSPDLRQDLDLACYNWSHFRDDAGVHYRSDSDLGLEVGSRVIRELLPAKLAEFGACPDEVRELIACDIKSWV